MRGVQSSGISQDSVMIKKSMFLVMIKSWQIKDLLLRDLTLSKQKLAEFTEGVGEMVLTLMRLFLHGA